jgi:ribosomal protein S14
VGSLRSSLDPTRLTPQSGAQRRSPTRIYRYADLSLGRVRFRDWGDRFANLWIPLVLLPNRARSAGPIRVFYRYADLSLGRVRFRDWGFRFANLWIPLILLPNRARSAGPLRAIYRYADLSLGRVRFRDWGDRFATTT